MIETIKYKQTSFGLIPIDWEVKKLGNLGKVISGLTYSPDDICEESGTLVLRSSNVQDGQIKLGDNVFVKVKTGEYNPVNKEDILICVRNGSKSLIGKNALITEEAAGMAFGAFMAIYRSDFNNYLYQIFNTDIYYREIHKNLGATINSINGSDLKEIKIPIPPLPEQNQIVSILATWDKAIDNCKGIVDNLKVRNNGLTQQLLSGKMRVKGFDKKWKVRVLSECLNFTPRPILKPSENYLALGLRSHGKGIFHKNDFDPASIAMETMYEVRENDLIINITFAWEHAVAIVSKKDEGGLVSHRFPTYTFNSQNAIPEYFRHFILQKRFKFLLELISPGGAGRNRVMSKTDFLKLELKIPDVEEQKAIANILDKATSELNQYQEKLQTLQLQKKGLMQQLLTGKVRVKTNN
ncbi:restriction endonuclease subunit S [Flavobacterium xinjiangense]|uniref:Type I restriction enzyme, S subunit n=1 Tax=Flavobacterium xinjiangense TaxID=178356 RepID=A0A1M7H254_9FLAO|nr:restriction endonuclease subunit S [Flavobacterium xinjiangense]SHM22473.1 type I restriction enzyme, S subunit [Flavobacterium xinjiangense]